MRDGAIANLTEGRPVLHVALRGTSGDEAANAAAAETRAAVRAFAEDVRSGKRAGAGGPFEAIVHIGIGGSDLGPRLLYDALKSFRRKDFVVRFAANVDGAEISDALEGLDPKRTLVVVVSKTFTTQETLANAKVARDWIAAAAGEEAVAGQIVAVSAAPERAQGWGAGAVFPFWDWVGGRYSLWSAVGLSVDAALEPGAFDALLDGAAAMDRHFFEAPTEENLPVCAAFVQAWNRLLGAGSYSVAAYGRRLQLLPSFLQQLEMESNGKSVDLDGERLPRLAAGVTWGDAGTNGQHSFFQLLHQGRDVVPVEFVLIDQGAEGPDAHRAMLLSNVLAQAQALLQGKTAETAKSEMMAQGETEMRADFLAPHRAFSGDRPSTIIGMTRLDPKTLGALLAFYEHRTAVQGWLAGLNSFDQWGVELGKVMANALLPALKGGDAPEGADPSTKAWLARLT
jgi:glucose-6-phosphate isomerase